MTLARFRCRALRRSGVTEVRVIQAASEEAARERLLAAGLEPLSIEAMGPSLFDGLGGLRLPDWRPSITMPAGAGIVAICLLASIPLTVALGAWSLAALANGKIARLETAAAGSGRADQPYLSQAARQHFAVALSRPTISDIARRLAAVSPQNASLAFMSGDGKGRLTIGIDTPDPDRLRLAIVTDPLLASLSETAQTRTNDGAIRVTLQGMPR